MADALLNRWAESSKVELLDSYGNTEVGFLYISNCPGEARRGSVGRPVEGLNVEVIDTEGKRIRAVAPHWKTPSPRTDGHSGLLERYGKYQRILRNGWFVTSDMFSVDRDGYYYIRGRSDHLIKLGCGDWVNPNEMEKVLLEHPSVSECAVVGLPDNPG